MGVNANTQLLAERLDKVARARDWPTGAIDQLKLLVESANERELHQINPHRYAADAGLEAGDAIQLLLHATRVGLLDIHWSLLCRGCGELVVNHGHLDQLDHEFYCASCARTCPTTLDDHVEVSFAVSPEVRAIRFHEPESLDLEDYFFGFRFSRNIVVRDDGAALIDYIRDRVRVLAWLEPGASHTATYELEAGWVVGSPRTMITAAGEPTDELQEVTLTYAGAAFEPRPEVRPGRVAVTLRNDTEDRVRVLHYFTPIVTYFDYRPHLSGSELLNDAAFRRCLGTEVVRPGSGIPVNDNTLLFTDLRGSTAMYDRIGDMQAFELVSDHFESLARVITRCSGVVVKTMGDAIMASFSGPADAVRAALLIVSEVRSLHRTGAEQLRAKLGVHRGPCILVNQNHMLDYFGQTVNIAARVQGAAGADELCLTDAVMEDSGVASLLSRFGPLEPEMMRLRGVGEPTAVYRVAVDPDVD